MSADARGLNTAVADGYKGKLATVTGFDRGYDADDKCYGGITNDNSCFTSNTCTATPTSTPPPQHTPGGHRREWRAETVRRGYGPRAALQVDPASTLPAPLRRPDGG